MFSRRAVRSNDPPILSKVKFAERISRTLMLKRKGVVDIQLQNLTLQLSDIKMH